MQNTQINLKKNKQKLGYYKKIRFKNYEWICGMHIVLVFFFCSYKIYMANVTVLR